MKRSETLHTRVLPGEDELPYSFGENKESEIHALGYMLLVTSLKLAWKDRDDVYIGGDMAIYFSERQIKTNDFRGPDVFVVLDTVRRLRKSWVVWHEHRTPDVVIEILSESTKAIDRGEKMHIYAKQLKVSEYFLWDPDTGEFEGYALDPRKGAYRRIKPDLNGDLPCRKLGLRLGVRVGSYTGVEAHWLRWLDADGRVLPTEEEVAEAAR